jgi:hypothetical protein
MPSNSLIPPARTCSGSIIKVNEGRINVIGLIERFSDHLQDICAQSTWLRGCEKWHSSWRNDLLQQSASRLFCPTTADRSVNISYSWR